jgi:ferric-dicitrate binding protein FerR (iron transport regulator)
MGKIGIKPVWPKSKDEIWVEVFENLEERKAKKIFLRRIPLWGYAAGLLLPLFLICQFYTVTEKSMRGELMTVQLPDRSTVTLNADSKLSYKPFSWLISRNVRLEGEGFFDVRHGSRFSVQSGSNRVRVLGTTFDVHNRPGLFRVTCMTGKVEVQTESESVELLPNMQVTLREQKLSLDNDVATSFTTGWMQGRFEFFSAPLREVIDEVERQYNIQVTPVTYPNYLFTGHFSKADNPEDVLEIISKPFGITLSIE